jgi:hypothetical protein
VTLIDRLNAKIVRRSLTLGLLAGLTSVLAVSAVQASAPPSQYAPSAQVVLDRKTKLTWERVLGKPGLVAYKDAVAYCAGLTLNNTTRGTWRLPRMDELVTLVDVRSTQPALDTVAFPSTPNGQFWTQSTYLYTPQPTCPNTCNWTVDFTNGQAQESDAMNAQHVRCVHN